MGKRRSKYATHFYCRRHGWIKKTDALRKVLSNNLIQFRCPHSPHRPLRVSSRERKFKKEYEYTRTVIVK